MFFFKFRDHIRSRNNHKRNKCRVVHRVLVSDVGKCPEIYYNELKINIKIQVDNSYEQIKE